MPFDLSVPIFKEMIVLFAAIFAVLLNQNTLADIGQIVSDRRTELKENIAIGNLRAIPIIPNSIIRANLFNKTGIRRIKII